MLEPLGSRKNGGLGPGAVKATIFQPSESLPKMLQVNALHKFVMPWLWSLASGGLAVRMKTWATCGSGWH